VKQAPRNSVANAAAWSTLGHLLTYGQGIIMVPLVVKLTGAATYGTYGLLVSLLTLIYGISSFGAGYHARRRLPSAPDGSARFVLFLPQALFQLASILVLATLFWLCKPILDHNLFAGGAPYSILAVYAYLLGNWLFGQAGDYFRYGHSIAIYNISIIFAPLLYVGSAVLAWQLGVPITVTLLLSLQGMAFALPGLVLLVLTFRDAGHVSLRGPATTLWSDILIGFPLILYLLVDNALAVGDRYIISLFMGIAAVGAYQPAYQLGSLIIMIGRIASVILPRFLAQRVDSGEKAGAEALLARTVRIYILLGMPFIFGSAMLARPLLRVLANTAISESAWTVVTPVAIGTVFYGLVTTLSQAAYVSGATRTILIANTIGAVVDLVLVTVGIWLLSQLWVAGLATMIAYLVTFVYLFGQLRHDWTVRIDWPFTLKSLLAAAAMAALLAVLGYGGFAPGASLVSLLLAMLAATVTYFAVLALLRAYDEREREMLRRLVRA
jgi:O-antigen/teichoic acid export membrane protein